LIEPVTSERSLVHVKYAFS